MLLLYISIFIISCLVLVRSGTWMVRSLTRIAQFLKWKEFIVASVLMAFATSLPELFVGITSALHHKPELSFGNVIGSNIINLTLIVGICVLVARGLKTEGVILQRNAIYTAFLASLPILLMLDNKISRVDGVVLLLALILYFYNLISREETFTKVFSDSFNREWTHLKLFLKDMGMFFLGILLLLLSAEGIVFSASFLAEFVSLPLIIVGALIVALGTNIPEIVFGIKAIIMKHKEMVLGNLMGSVVINSTLVLGITFLIYPLEIPDFSFYAIGIIFTIFSALLFVIFSRTGKEISKKEAFILLFVYVIFVAFQLFIS